MTPIRGPVMETHIEWGVLRAPIGGWVTVGDRVVPPVIEADLPSTDGQPSLFMRIEVIDGVPRCIELTIRSADGGREVRPRDLAAVQLESWVESFVTICSGHLESSSERGWRAGIGESSEASVRAGMRVIRDVRKGSRRPMTGERRQRVADVYNAHPSGGIEAVKSAFAVSRSTAIRYIRAARVAGLIEERDSLG